MLGYIVYFIRSRMFYLYYSAKSLIELGPADVVYLWPTLGGPIVDSYKTQKWRPSAMAQKRPYYNNKVAILQNNNGSPLVTFMADENQNKQK